MAGTTLALAGLAFGACGNDSTTSNTPPSSGTAAATDLGNFNMSCNGQSTQGQQKQVPFQQQQQSGCKKQSFQFQQQKVGDYDVDLDCGAKQVVVKSKGFDQQQQAIPIQSDGTVKGKVQYQQQLQNDGKGNQVCWVQYAVDFDGKAQCGGSQISPQPTPSASPALKLTTTVSFQQADPNQLQQAGVEGPIVNPNGSPSPEPSASPSPSPSVSPSPSPSPSASPSPSMTPTPSGTPVVICVVDDPCPLQGSTDLSCGSNTSAQ